MSQRYVALFLDDLTNLQTKLTVVDSVITIWIEVQRTWAHLETIFIGSADIRAQLPQDSERFDGIGPCRVVGGEGGGGMVLPRGGEQVLARERP